MLLNLGCMLESLEEDLKIADVLAKPPTIASESLGCRHQDSQDDSICSQCSKTLILVSLRILEAFSDLLFSLGSQNFTHDHTTRQRWVWRLYCSLVAGQFPEGIPPQPDKDHIWPAAEEPVSNWRCVLEQISKTKVSFETLSLENYHFMGNRGCIYHKPPEPTKIPWWVVFSSFFFCQREWV